MADSRQSGAPGRPVAIRRLLATVLEDKKWKSKLELHRVFEFWNGVMGREIAAVAQPSVIRGHILWVKVAEPVWMQQLHLQKTLLLEKINLQLDGEEISDIRFQLNSSLPPPQPEPETRMTKPVLIDRKKEQAFDRLISSLDNDDLKASLKSLWVRMQSSKR
jgi:predicted nucleic acid-binding Zn ribbon protein